ncbi:hypothetical protein [Pedobacter sp. MC2016-24]|uniref:hypothetical protein n=1 Tax=Pedobacter sp. MC2016-24 TaxID=2780090 RepID=UPI00187F645F|nr:hypothetical protein [Pedobacter sp. MC2016-24]MBE9598749.1 hypothetical protein [Pedobacter sp. MC2016-24]
MKKVIISKNLNLSFLSKTEGTEGVIIIKQDSIGGHQITLAEGNIGDVLLNPEAHTATILTYYIDDELTYWQTSYSPEDSNNALPYTLPFTLR